MESVITETHLARRFLAESMEKLSQCYTVIEIGSGKPFGKELAPYKELFVDCEWQTLDIDPSVEPDIVDDITDSKLETESVDGVVCKSIFEHISEPFKAVDEIYRVLKSGGCLFSYVPFLCPYHGCSRYHDYYRFSADGIKQLFHLFALVEICEVRGPLSSLMIWLPIRKSAQHFLYSFFFLVLLDKILMRKSWFKNLTSGYYVYAEKRV